MSKLTQEEVGLFYFMRNEILVIAEDLEEDKISHTDAASYILRLAEHINETYDRMAKK